MATTPTLVSQTSKSTRPSNRNGYERSLTELMQEVHSYLATDEIEFVQSAYEYAYLAHEGHLSRFRGSLRKPPSFPQRT